MTHHRHTQRKAKPLFVLDDDGPARFVAISAPRDEDVEAILRRVIRRTAKALVGHEDMDADADALAALQAAEGL